jgi:hypothetical protein
MSRTLLLLVATLSTMPVAHAQSKEDRLASLAGVLQIGIQESGVSALGGGTAGSPYLLQAEAACKGAGLRVVELERATAHGTPIYDVLCSAADAGDALRVACEGRFLRQVFLERGERAKNVYAITWTSPLIVANVPRDVVSDVQKLTQMLVDSFVKDWREANPGMKAPKKK